MNDGRNYWIRLLNKLDKPEMLILNHLYRQIEKYETKNMDDRALRDAYLRIGG